MRTIKFRAWDRDKKEMTSDIAAIHFDYRYPGIYSYGGFGEEMHTNGNYEVELMQFTGLLDKNGHEIFEGDIIKNEKVAGKNNPLTVKWYETRGGFSPFIWWSQHEADETEVIGNIYENPELLESR